MRVPFDLELPYDEASRLATRDYAGKTYQVNGKPRSVTPLATVIAVRVVARV